MLRSLAVNSVVLDNNLPLLPSSGCVITCLWSVAALGCGDVQAANCLLFKYHLVKPMNTWLNSRIFRSPGGTSTLEVWGVLIRWRLRLKIPCARVARTASLRAAWLGKRGAAVHRPSHFCNTITRKLVCGTPERARGRKKMVMVKYVVSNIKVERLKTVSGFKKKKSNPFKC